MSRSCLSLLAPAKINLFLHITGRRADGYHELQTVFQLLNFSDQLTFQTTRSGNNALHCNHPRLPLDDNLILRAVAKLGNIASSRRLKVPGIDITLNKQIPLGAGLGGGSSNAATTLIALNLLWQLKLSENQLCQIGLELGADIPLFIRGNSAWGEGVGEILQAVQLPEYWYLVITPDCQVSTAEIFSHEQLTRDSSAIKMADFLAALTAKRSHLISRNDCEAVTRMLYPKVDESLNWLDQYGTARMTGTGASVFAVFDDKESADRTLAALPQNIKGFVAKGINCLQQDKTACG